MADRTHNIRTLRYVPPHKQKAVARETLELYAPLAHRLGIFWLKTELEDTSLRYLEPDVYEDLKVMVSSKKEERQAYTQQVYISFIRIHTVFIAQLVASSTLISNTPIPTPYALNPTP